MKPQSAGQLTHHVLKMLDNGTIWTKVIDPEAMEQKLPAHSQNPFIQAKGTPYTTAPLNNLLRYDGLTKFVDQVLSGNIPPNIPVPPAWPNSYSNTNKA